MNESTNNLKSKDNIFMNKWPACPTSCTCIALIAHVWEILPGCLAANRIQVKIPAAGWLG